MRLVLIVSIHHQEASSNNIGWYFIHTDLEQISQTDSLFVSSVILSQPALRDVEYSPCNYFSDV